MADQKEARIDLVFEGGAVYSIETTKVAAERIATAVSRALTSGTAGQVKFDLASGDKQNYVIMDGSRILAVRLEIL